MKLDEILEVARMSAAEDMYVPCQVSVSYRDCYDAIRSIRNSEELLDIAKLIM